MKTILSCFLISLFLFGNVGLVIQKHYCKDEVKSVALFAHPQECEHAQKPVCHSSTSCHAPASEDKDCCENEADYLKASSDLFQTAAAEAIVFLPVVAILPNTAIDIQHREESSIFCQIKPPLIAEGTAKTILLQSFLC